MVVVGVVGTVVVPVAQQGAVGEIGRAAGCPGLRVVVGLAPGGRDVAVLGAAGAVAHGHGPALRRSEEARGAAEVEDLGGAAENDGDDLGGAGQAAGLGGSDGGVAAKGRGAEPIAEGGQVDGDQDGGGVAAVPREPVRIHGLEHGAESLAEPAVVALGKIGDPIAKQALAGLFDDDGLSKEAVKALNLTDDPSVVELLLEGSKNASPRILAACADAFKPWAKTHPAVLARLKELAGHAFPQVRSAALRRKSGTSKEM